MMTKKLFSQIACSMALLILMGGCASHLKPLEAQYVKATPQPLELRGGHVPVDIYINFPSKWFPNNVELSITPVLRYTGGEAWGTTTVLQGESVRGNGQMISYKRGGKAHLQSNFLYKPEMANSSLWLTFRATVQNGRKVTNIPDIKIAEGVLATEALANIRYVTPALAPDAFQRIIKQAFDANILFLIQQAGLRPTQLTKEEMRQWNALVENASQTPNQKVDVEVQAYASPDGGLQLNERLAAQREKNTSNYLRRQFKRNKIDAPVAAHYTAEDWEGFRKLVEKSDLQDKDLVLRVLSMYKDPVQREQEIKNISSVFKDLADKILPQLRRSRLIANVEIIGKSDDEILSLVKTNPRQLTVEELLYAATLVKNPQDKKQVYELVTQLYPKDARAYNNLGRIAYELKDYAKAEDYYNKAAEIANANAQTVPAIKMNEALIALSKDEVDKAEQLLGQATEVPELGEALGYLYIKQGKYDEAAKELYNTPTNNGVLAQLLNRDYNRAMALAKQIASPDAQTYYLLAVLGARTDNMSMVKENIKQALAINPSLKSEIANDREFVKYAANPYFQSLR